LTPEVSSALALIPNIGAEEGADWPALLHKPAVASTVALWRNLFPSNHRLLGSENTPEPWPECMGARPEEAAFAWLEDVNVACWLADPKALSLARENGLHWQGPSADDVLRVHDKAFAFRASREFGLIPPELRGLGFVLEPQEMTSSSDWIDRLEREFETWPAWTQGRFCLKPRLGSSGRGRVSGRAGSLDRATLSGAARTLACRGGAIVEPWLERTVDFSVQLHIGHSEPATTPSVTILGGLQLWVTATGLYRGHLGEVDSRGRIFSGGPHEEIAREASATIAAEAQRRGYSGPCGVDGLGFRVVPATAQTAPGVTRPVVEFNARFTLGTLVIGLVRRLLGRLQSELQLSPGQRCAFLFALDTPPDWPSWEALAQHLQGRTLCLPLAPASATARPGLIFADSIAGLQAALPHPT